MLFGYAWWAPLVLGGAWLATHWLLRESGVWRDRNTEEVRAAQQEAEYAYRLAVDPPAAKEVRLFGLADWVLDRFVDRRRHLHQLQYEATRLRERPLLGCVLLVLAANVLLFWVLAADLLAGPARPRARSSVYAQAALGRRDDRVRRAELGARRRVRAGRRRAAARAEDRAGRRAGRPGPTAADGRPATRDPLPRGRASATPAATARRCCATST